MPIDPKRGEIWPIDLNPSAGSEYEKVRPCVIISSNGVGILPVRLVVPITGWQPGFAGRVWMVRIDPSAPNGLRKPSAADTLQTRCVALERFDPYNVGMVGILDVADIKRVAASLAATIDFEI